MRPLRHPVALAALGLGAFLAASAPVTTRGVESAALFSIARSKNANIVRYDVRLAGRGSYDIRRPLDVYWLLNATTEKREELSELELHAYGYKMQPGASANAFHFALNALPSRPITVEKQNDRFRAVATIQGAPAYLDRVFVTTSESGPMPKVLYLDIFGALVADGRSVTERVAPK